MTGGDFWSSSLFSKTWVTRALLIFYKNEISLAYLERLKICKTTKIGRHILCATSTRMVHAIAIAKLCYCGWKTARCRNPNQNGFLHFTYFYGAVYKSRVQPKRRISSQYNIIWFFSYSHKRAEIHTAGRAKERMGEKDNNKWALVANASHGVCGSTQKEAAWWFSVYRGLEILDEIWMFGGNWWFAIKNLDTLLKKWTENIKWSNEIQTTIFNI
jgi:hypothetical protein